MRLTNKPLYVIVLASLAFVALLTTGCGGKAEPTEEVNVFIAPLPADRAEMAIPAPNGSMPCGLGEVGWGYRVFRVEEFPACMPFFPNVEVFCLTADAQWSAVNVSNVDISTETNTVAFDVRQDGVCALIPSAPTTPAAGVTPTP